MSTNEKAQICDLLRVFIHQRPGLDFGNYGDVSAYRSESRAITRDLHDAETLLAYVERHDSIDAAMLRDGFRAFSGRLSLVDLPSGRLGIEYCTGQYWPTEYRKAACAVLSAAIWGWIRDHCIDVTHAPVERHSNLANCGDLIRKTARRELGATIARRWFN